jgi:hypothetical protein
LIDSMAVTRKMVSILIACPITAAWADSDVATGSQLAGCSVEESRRSYFLPLPGVYLSFQILKTIFVSFQVVDVWKGDEKTARVGYCSARQQTRNSRCITATLEQIASGPRET